jgi:hypothetical protein
MGKFKKDGRELIEANWGQKVKGKFEKKMREIEFSGENLFY